MGLHIPNVINAQYLYAHVFLMFYSFKPYIYYNTNYTPWNYKNILFIGFNSKTNYAIIIAKQILPKG